MQLQFAAQAQGLSDGQRHGVVHLEGVVGGLVLILGIAVGEVDKCRRRAEVAGHLGGGRTVVQLVGQYQRLRACLIEEVLVVETSAERCARVLHIRRTAIAEAIAKITAHGGGRCAGTLHAHTVDRGRGVDGAHGAELITQREASHGERGLHFVFRSHQLRHAVVLNLLHLGGGVSRLVVTIHGIGAIRELALLSADECTSAHLLGTCRCTNRAVVAVHAWSSCRRCLSVHHDVQDARRTLGIVFGTGIGHHLDALHGRGRHAFEHHRGIR